MNTTTPETSTSHNNMVSDVWVNGPTQTGLLVYGFVVPVITACGGIFNLLNILVYCRPNMSASIYTYLCALSCCDFVSCGLVFFSSIAKSLKHSDQAWQVYDTMWHLPIVGISGGIGNYVIVGVAIDRLVYIKSFMPRGAPPFCCPMVARKCILTIVVFVSLTNIPCFMIFEVDEYGFVQTTDFYYSKFYFIYNWVKLIVMGIIPVIFLCIANGIMIHVIKQWSKCKHLLSPCNCKARKKIEDQTRLTISLIAIIVLFFMGEIPTYFASRKSASALLASIDTTTTDRSEQMESFRLIVTLVYSLSISMNIVFYAALNPAYLKELFIILQFLSCKYECKPDEKTKRCVWSIKGEVKHKRVEEVSSSEVATTDEQCDGRNHQVAFCELKIEKCG